MYESIPREPSANDYVERERKLLQVLTMVMLSYIVISGKKSSRKYGVELRTRSLRKRGSSPTHFESNETCMPFSSSLLCHIGTEVEMRALCHFPMVEITSSSRPRRFDSTLEFTWINKTIFTTTLLPTITTLALLGDWFCKFLRCFNALPFQEIWWNTIWYNNSLKVSNNSFCCLDCLSLRFKPLFGQKDDSIFLSFPVQPFPLTQ